MKNIYEWPLWHWHFELTSICTLKCPRCSRTEIPDDLVIDSLDLNFFKDNFTADVVSNIKRISLCGYDGDPIYNKQFIEICNYFKTINPTLEIYIVTNGSYKTAEWWTRLGDILNEYDQIHFSIDGWDQESNEKYRINSNWESIVNGITALRGQAVRLVWDAIYFDFNYTHIDDMITTAKELGFDAFRITKSNKFNFYYDTYSTDLEPPKEFISNSGRFENETIQLSDRRIYNDSFDEAVSLYQQQDKSKSIIPLCKIGTKGLFVDSQGYFYPCCWIINRYNKETYQNWLTDDKNIRASGIDHVLNNTYWEQFLNEISSNDICKLKCNAQEVTMESVQRW